MLGLPEGEKSLRISLLVSMEYTNVSDRQTGGQTPRHSKDRDIHSKQILYTDRQAATKCP